MFLKFDSLKHIGVLDGDCLEEVLAGNFWLMESLFL